MTNQRQLRLVRRTVSSDWEKIGPREAEKMLASLDPRQRHLSNAYVDKYTAEFKEGTFCTYHPPILISSQGYVMDGQHRLWAIALSGVSVNMMVTRGADPADFDKLDRGKNRSMADLTALPKREVEIVTGLYKTFGQSYVTPAQTRHVHTQLEPELKLAAAHKIAAGATATLRGACVILFKRQPDNILLIDHQLAAFIHDRFHDMKPAVEVLYKKVRVDKTIPTTNRSMLFDLAFGAFAPDTWHLRRLRPSEERMAVARKLFKRIAG